MMLAPFWTPASSWLALHCFLLIAVQKRKSCKYILKALKVFLVTAESLLNESISIYCMQVQSCCLLPSYPMSRKSIVLVLLILHLCEQCSPWGLAEGSWGTILISAAMQKCSCSWWPRVWPSRTRGLLFDFWRLLLELFLAAGYKTQPRGLKNVKEKSLSLEEGLFHPLLRRWGKCLSPRDGWYLCAAPYCHSKQESSHRMYCRHTFSSLFSECHRQFRRQENLS